MTSNRIDDFMDKGTAADYLSRLSAERPDLCLCLAWGRLEAGYWGEYALVSEGTRGVVPTSADWGAFALKVGALPRRELFPSSFGCEDSHAPAGV